MKLFNLCYEYRYDGGEAQAVARGKVIKTGFYTRICLPANGGLLDQPYIVMEILRTMANRFDDLRMRKAKK